MDASVGSLLVLGAASVIAAIVGGNVKLPGGAEFGPLARPVVRLCLFAAGGLFFVVALGLSAEESEFGDRGGADAEPSRVEYAESVAHICRKWKERFTLLNFPANGQFESSQELANTYSQAGSIFQSWASDMKSAQAPRADREALWTIYNDLYSAGSAMLEVANAASASDRQGLEEAHGRAMARMAQYNSASESYGLDPRCQAAP